MPTRRNSMTAAVFALLAAACDSRDPPPPITVPVAGFEQLCARLDRLIDRLDAPTAARSAGDRTVPPQRVAVDDEVPALRARVAALEGELAILRAQTTAAAGAIGAMPRPAVIEPIRADAVARTIAGCRADETKSTRDTLRDLLLMGPAQVLQTFGMPTGIWVDKTGSVKWSYEVGDDSMTVTFDNGQLMNLSY